MNITEHHNKGYNKEVKTVVLLIKSGQYRLHRITPKVTGIKTTYLTREVPVCRKSLWVINLFKLFPAFFLIRLFAWNAQKVS